MTQDMRKDTILMTVQRSSGFISTTLRSLLLLVMMTVGVNSVWGQTDYSGTYYIAFFCDEANVVATYNAQNPTNNYYWCPVECTNSWKGWFKFYPTDDTATDTKADTYQDTDSGMDFLTTYRFRGDANYDSQKAVWTIIKYETLADCYYIKHRNSGKYLTFNGYMKDAKSQNRLRVHLQEGSNNMSLFTIRKTNNYFLICPQSKDNQNFINVSGNSSGNTTGNENILYGGTGRTDGPTGLTNIGGTLGVYTAATDRNGKWYLEDVITRPMITYNASDKIEITHPDASTDNTFKYYYTTDGSKPEVTIVGQTISPKSGTTTQEYPGPFTVAADVATVKAIAVRTLDNEVSNVTAFSVPIHCGVDYVIQSKESAFYYLIPNLKIGNTDYPKNLTTLNVPCSTMVWNFEDASDGDGEYYYIHNSQGGYLYYTATNNSDKYVYFNAEADKNTSDDGYKFSITRHTSGGYNIIPKGQTIPINKSSVITASGNAKLTAVKLAGAVGDATSRWELKRYTSTDNLPQWTDEPFKVWDNDNKKFYQIKSLNPEKGGSNDVFIIVNNSNGIQVLPTSDFDSRQTLWIVNKVEAKDTDHPNGDDNELLDYYTFQNAYTGEFLYINKLEKEVKTDASPGMLQMGQPDGADATWSHFVIVQTLNGGYNIIPRVLVDNTKAINTGLTHEGFNCINRANGGVYTGTWYDNDNGSRWTFEEYTEDVQCMKPVITYQSESEKIRISTIYDNATIYYTINDDDPKDPGVTPTSFETTTTLYTEIDLSTVTGKVKAYVSKTGYTDSETETYTISFEAPVISYDAINDKIIITPSPGATVYYTTGETTADDPTETETQKYTYGSTGFALEDDINVIKAKAVKGNAVSDIVSLTIFVHAHTTANDRPYLVQSVHNTAFYMIPGDVDKGVTYVNTSSLGRPSMEWYFIGAGHENDVTYYYIKNKATNEYVCYTSSSVRLHTAETFDAAADKDIYKFTINYANTTTNPGYYIHPVTNATPTNGLSKDKGNNEINVFNLANATNKDYTYARWNFILSANKPAMSPQFKVWGNDDRKYYKIKKNTATDATATYLVPRSKTVSYAIGSVEADVLGPANSILWYFDVAYSDEWVTYYYVVNAATGEYLYFNGNETKSANDNAFETREELVAADNDRYLFAFAKTITANQYYILPKVLQNLVKDKYSLVFWDGYGALTSAADRAADGGKWYLAEADVTDLCPPRVKLDADGNVTISSRTRGATIKYKVGSETDFNNNAIPQMTDGSQVVITTQTTLEGVETTCPVTVVYKPTVELKANQTFVFNGQTHAPELNSVMIGTEDITNYCEVSSDDINAGDATAVVTQKENNPFYSDPYYVIYGTAPFTIEKSPLTIYADSKTIEYGDAMPELSFSTSGLATIDEVHVNLSCAATASSKLGTYPITFSNLDNKDVKYEITRNNSDASPNYKDITLIPSYLIITGKSLGDGTQMAEGITAELSTNGDDIVLTAGNVSLGDDAYDAVVSTEGYYQDKIWTVSGKGNYTGSAQLARVKSNFSEKDNEWRAGYVASHDWAIPEGSNIKAWIAIDVNHALNVLRVKEVNYLPGGVPAILTAIADKSNGVLVSPKTDEIADITDAQKNGNLFRVVENDLGVTTTDYKYVFHKGELVLAFRGTTLPKGTIYVDSDKNGSPVTAGAPLRIEKVDDLTGIIEINEDKNIRPMDDKWYSLDGRKLSGKPVQKGLYINKGRKIVVK